LHPPLRPDFDFPFLSLSFVFVVAAAFGCVRSRISAANFENACSTPSPVFADVHTTGNACEDANS